MNDSTSKPSWLTPEVQEHLRHVEYDYQAREFGEEMARINFLPAQERRKQIAEMMDHAARKGVNFERPTVGVTR